MIRPPKSARSGFSLVELVIVVVVLAILTGLALPNLRHAVIRAHAAEVLADFNVIRVAAHAALNSAGEFPRSRAWGTVPPEFASGLPEGFRFRQEEITYRWTTWSPLRSPFNVETGVISVRLETPRFRLGTNNEDLLLQTLLDLLPTNLVRMPNKRVVQIYVLP